MMTLHLYDPSRPPLTPDERAVLDDLGESLERAHQDGHGWRVAAAHIADAADLLAHQRPEAAEFLDDAGRGRG